MNELTLRKEVTDYDIDSNLVRRTKQVPNQSFIDVLPFRCSVIIEW